MASEIELKPCPFCGGRAQILHGGLWCKASVECTKCGGSMEKIDDKDPVWKAISAWNRRVGNGK